MAKGQPSVLINPCARRANTGLPPSYLLQPHKDPPPISVCKILVLLQTFYVPVCSVCPCLHVCGYMCTVVHIHARLSSITSYLTDWNEGTPHLADLHNTWLWTLDFQRAVTSTWLFWGLGDPNSGPQAWNTNALCMKTCPNYRVLKRYCCINSKCVRNMKMGNKKQNANILSFWSSMDIVAFK